MTNKTLIDSINDLFSAEDDYIQAGAEVVFYYPESNTVELATDNGGTSGAEINGEAVRIWNLEAGSSVVRSSLADKLEIYAATIVTLADESKTDDIDAALSLRFAMENDGNLPRTFSDADDALGYETDSYVTTGAAGGVEKFAQSFAESCALNDCYLDLAETITAVENRLDQIGKEH